MSEGLQDDMRSAVLAEYERACEEHGERNASDHESFAVILEEYDEATDESADFKKILKEFWNDVKGNDATAWQLDQLKDKAIMAAAEWVQVAAMCHKASVGKK